MRLDPSVFNSFLNGIGQRVLWRRAFACPCIALKSGAPKPSCPLCLGKGRLWDDGIECVVGVGERSAARRFSQLGVWEDGDSAITVGSDTPAYDMGAYDRVVMLNSQVVFSMTLIRGGPPIDELRAPIISISRVFWLTPDGTGIVEGGVPTVGDDGRPTWITGAPPLGTQYSVTGTKHAEYYVFTKLPTNRNEHSGSALPRLVHLRSFDLLSR